MKSSKSGLSQEVLRCAGWRVSLSVLLLVLLALPGTVFISGARAGDEPQGQITSSAPAGERMSMDQFVENVLSNSPRVKSSHASWKAAGERPLQDGALPNPMATVSAADPASGYSFPGAAERKYGLEQTFPWFGKRGARERMAVKDAEIAGLELLTVRRDVVRQAKEAYLELYVAQRSLEITAAEEAVLARLLKSAGAKYRTGQTGQQDVLKVQSESIMLKARVLEMQSRLAAAESRVRELLLLGSEKAVPTVERTVPGTELMDMDKLVMICLKNCSDVISVRKKFEKSLLAVELAEKNSYPDFKIGGEYQQYAGGENMFMVTAGIELPLWVRRNAASVREARNAAEAVDQERVALERESVRDIEQTMASVNSLRKQLKLFNDELVPQAESRLSIAEAEYGAGKTMFQDVIESERLVLNARLQSVATEGALGRELAELEWVVGSNPGAKADGVKPAGELK